MKKITLFAFAIAALSFASCKKARTCTCTNSDTTTYNYSTGTAPAASTSTSGYTDVSTTKLSKKAAKAWCTSGTMVYTDTQSSSGGTYGATTTRVETCTLK